MVYEFEVTQANAGRRLEAVVLGLLPTVPRHRLMKWLRVGKIRLNGGRTRPRALCAEGDRVRLPFDPEAADPVATAPHRGPAWPKRLPSPEVLFEDQDLLVANKPAHLAAHPGMQHHHDSLIARVVLYLGRQEAPVGERPGLAQRLDAGVTGIVPCGKNARALRFLSGPPDGPPLHKTYLALASGRVAADAGAITAPLRVTNAPMGNVPKVVVDVAAGQAAHTDYRVVARFVDATLLEVTLRTGRTHQIRAHLRHLGHALLGDPRYGSAARNAYLAQSFGIDRPLLHASALSFVVPSTLERRTVRAPLPEDFARLLSAFGYRGQPEASAAASCAGAVPGSARP